MIEIAIIIALLIILLFISYKAGLFLIISALTGAGIIILGGLDEATYKPLPEIVDMTNKKMIGGPVSMHVLKSKKYNKNIIMFGDYHSIEKLGCDDSVYLPEYIRWLLKTNDKFFDIFAETRYEYETKKMLSSNKYGMSGVINNFIKMFKSCLIDLTDRKKCQETFPNARFHNTDPRSVLVTPENANILNLGYAINHMNNLISSNINNFIIDVNSGKFDKNNFKSFYQNIYPYLSFYNDKNVKYLIELGTINNDRSSIYMMLYEFRDKILNNSIPNNKIKKNYDKIPNELRNNIEVAIDTLIYEEISHYNLLSLKNLTIIKNDIDNYEELIELKNTIDMFDHYILKLYTMLMDLYLFSRIFRKFEKTKSGNLESNPDANNIIILAGDFHIEVYKRAFLYLDFESLFSVNITDKLTDKSKKCIDIQNLPTELDGIKLKY
jgi:hypothetical protein